MRALCRGPLEMLISASLQPDDRGGGIHQCQRNARRRKMLRLLMSNCGRATAGLRARIAQERRAGRDPRSGRAPLVVLSALALALTLSWSAVALAATPGTVLRSTLPDVAPLTAPAAPLSPFLSESGEHLALSVDALGDNEPTGGPIKVEKKDA